MGSNVKVASLVSLGFIGTMSWMLNGMARPIADLPIAAPAALIRAGIEAAPGEALAAVPFERASAVAPSVEDESAAPRIEMPPTVLGPLAAQPEPVVPPLDRILAERNEAPRDMSERENEVSLTAMSAPAANVEVTGGSVNATDAVVPSPSSERVHVVVKGDTLSKIARSEWKRGDPGALKLLLAANPQLKGHADRIRIGQKLVIPSQPAGAVAADAPLAAAPRAAEPAAKAASGTKTAERKVAEKRADVPKSAKVAATGERGRSADKPPVDRGGSSASGRRVVAPETARRTTKAPRWYTIQRSDSLKSIARRYLNDDRRWREIAELNELNARRPVEAGRRIKLPPA